MEFEDETMHSRADVDAFTASLNRDIKGNKSTSQTTESNSVHLSHESKYSFDQFVTHWHNPRQDKLTNRQVQRGVYQQQEPYMMGSRIQIPLQPQSVQNLHIQSQRVQNHQVAESQYEMSSQSQTNLQQTPSQLTMPTQNLENTSRILKKVSFEKLIPVIVPLLDKDKSAQLQSLYFNWTRNEGLKEEFLGFMKEIVGEKIITTGIYNLRRLNAAGNSQFGSRQNLSRSHSQLHEIQKKGKSKKRSRRAMKEILGQTMIKMGSLKLQNEVDQNSQTGPNQFPNNCSSALP